MSDLKRKDVPVNHVFFRTVVAVSLLGTICVGGIAAKAESLADLVPGVLSSHDQIKAAEADVRAAKDRVRVAVGAWYPELTLTANYGYENQIKPEGTEDTDLTPRELDVSVTQLIWDFGATNSAVRIAALALEQSKAVLETVRPALLLRSATTYLNVQRAWEVLSYAKRSEGNIKRQTELETALVERGAGFSTDVLQAKVQLAGAQARRIQARGAVQVAINAYRGIFGHAPGDLESLVKPVLPVDLIPPTLEEVVTISLENNPQLKAALVANQISRETVKSTRSSNFFPSLSASGDLKFKESVGGTVGFQRESLIKVEATFPFNLGFTAVNTLRASKSDLTATERRYADSRDAIEEQARNAWENLMTARDNAAMLMNQANIAGEFLELARKERQMDRRSLLDVLAGETALLNASSDAVSAETDVAIAVYTLLNTMGRLDQAAVTGVPVAATQ